MRRMSEVRKGSQPLVISMNGHHQRQQHQSTYEGKALAG